jgi:DNA repair/transcription protein MET18/MMS19
LRYTLSHAVPHLTKLFVDPDELPNRGPVLSRLSSLITAARDSAAKVDHPEEISLFQFKDEVLGILVTGLKAQSSLRPAIDGLRGLVTTPGLLDDQEIGFVVQKVNEVISSQQDDPLGARCSSPRLSQSRSAAHDILVMLPSICLKSSLPRHHLI